MHEITFEDAATSHAHWDWVHPLLGEPWTVGGDIPLGYESHVSIPNSLEPEDNGCSLAQPPVDPERDAVTRPGGLDQLARLVAVLSPATGDQPIHCAMWEGFGGMFRESDGAIQGASLAILWSSDDVTPPAERERQLAETRREWAASRPLRPRATTLGLPMRDCYTWTSTLADLAADAQRLDGYTPLAVFPTDRTWFWHSEIDSRRTEVAGPGALLAPLLEAPVGGFAVDRDTAYTEIPGWPDWEP